MPAGNLHDAPRLSREARRKLLLVACTVDRVNILAKIQKPGRSGPPTAHTTPAWLGTAAAVAARFLPPKLRLATALWQMFRAR